MSEKSKRGAIISRSFSRRSAVADLYEGSVTIANTCLTVSLTAAIGSPAAANARCARPNASTRPAANARARADPLLRSRGLGAAWIGDGWSVECIASLLRTLLLAASRRADVVDELSDHVLQNDRGFGLAQDSAIGQILAAAGQNRNVLVADQPARSDRRDRVAVDLDAAIDAHGDLGPLAVERNPDYLADRDARNLDAVAALEPRDVVEVGVDHVTGRREQLQLAQAEGQKGQRRQPRQGEKADDKLSGAACVH